jgi:hypothetical protein
VGEGVSDGVGSAVEITGGVVVPGSVTGGKLGTVSGGTVIV